MSSQSISNTACGNLVQQSLIQVALPVPLYRCFDYLPVQSNPPSSPLPGIGSRVQVPFGKRTLIGVVVAHVSADDSDIATGKLKAIDAVLDASPILDVQMMKVAKWLAA